MKKKFFYLAVFLCFITRISAQNGPGGIGNKDGSNGQPHNILWLYANSLGLTDGEEVAGWNDISGNENHMVSASSNPNYVSNVINGNGIVRFEEASSQYLDFYSDFNTSGINGIEGSTYSFFWVAARRDVTARDQYVFGGTSATANSNLYSGWGYSGGYALGANHWGNNCYATTYYTDTNNEFGFVSCVFNAASIGNTRELFDVGTLIASSTSSSQLGNVTDMRLGYRGGSGNNYADIDIAEVIFYKDNLNTAQRRIVENYLSAKYDIAFQATSNDKYTGHDASYIDAVAGIGQESDGNHLAAYCGGLYIDSNGNLDNGEYLLVGHNSSITNTISLNDLPTGVEGRWLKDWYFDQTGSQNVTIKFDLPEAIGGLYPQNINNYVLLYRSGTSGTYSEVIASVNVGDVDQIAFDVNGSEILDGYYTLGTKDESSSPLKGDNGVTLYTLVSGDWNDWETWTLDPSGALPNNPNHLYPKELSDNVVVKGGKTVTMNINNIQCATLKVEGRLDLAATTGHSFGDISGSGRILLSADNFPSYTDCSGFIDEGEDHGTVVFYGNSSYSLNTAYTFYNIEINMDAGRTVTLLDDYTINGNLTVTSGNLKINDNSSTDLINLTVNGDVTIASAGKISTGTGNTYTYWGGNHSQYHQFIIKGDFTNNGTAQFTNRTSADYSNDDYTGATEVIFNSDTKDQKVLCNGATVFNQLTCDKGTDDTYILDVSASAVANFNLYGRNNEAVTGDSDIGGDRDGNKALRLLAGTLKLGSNIIIPQLAEDNTFEIDADARLWLYANASVTVDSEGWVAVYGTLQCSDNSSYNEITNEGTILRGRSKLNFEGGTHNINAIRTSVWGTAGDHLGAYVQSGGTVNIVNESRNNSYASFHLPFQSNVFQMSGGTLNIEDQGNSGVGDDFALIINSSEENYNVTGGTVIIDMIYDVDYKINTRAPLYNLIVRNTNGSSRTFSIDAFTAANDDTETIDPAQPLVILNDLIIEGANSPVFNTDNVDVTIGGDFRIEEGATYNYGTNTTTFNGTEDAELYIGYTGENDGYEQQFYDFAVSKSTGKSLTITGDTEKTAQFQLDNGYSHTNAKLVTINNNLTIESGILNQGEHSIGLNGPIEVKANGQCGVYEEGTTHLNAMIMLNDAIAVTSQDGAVFGNVKVNPNNSADIITFSSDIYIKRISYFQGRLNLGSNNIKVDYLHNELTTNNYDISSGNAYTEMFYFGGNSSDGGLSILITQNGTYGFPIGVNGKYTPVEMEVENFGDNGYVTISLAQGELKTTYLHGGDLLNYYWSVKKSGFTSVPDVKFDFHYNNSDVVGYESGYYPGSVLTTDPYTRSFINDLGRVDEFNNIITYDDGSGGGISLVEANYSAGTSSRFVGAPTIYYSTTVNNGNDTDFNNNDNWNQSSRWSTVGHYSGTNTGSYPHAGDIAIIGFGLDNSTDNSDDNQRSHWFYIDTNISAAALVFADEVVNANGDVVQRSSSYNPQLTIEADNSISVNFGVVEGQGTFNVEIECSSCSSNPSYSVPRVANIYGDFGDFALDELSQFDYDLSTSDNSAVYLPTNFPSEYPNLHIKGKSGNGRVLIFQEDIEVNRDLVVREGATLRLSDLAEGDITVGRNIDLTINSDGDDIQFPSSGPGRTLSVGGDIIMDNSDDDILVLDNNSWWDVSTHVLEVAGSIQVNEGDIDLYNGTGNHDNAILRLTGTNDGTYTTSNQLMDLYGLEVAKENASFSLDNDVNLFGPTSGVGVNKSIDLQSGALVFNHVDIDVDLTTGDDNFNIPSGATIEVKKGVVNASGGSGIDLSGSIVLSGGTLDMSGGDNPIVYSSSGTASIEISDGNLYVGSQIRRGETTSEGILAFNQSGGNVEIGQDAAGISDRGVFEILNSGSSFTHTNGNFTLVNDLRSNPTIASLYFDPETINLDEGTAITFGNASSTALGNKFTIYGGQAFQNINIINTSATNPKLTSSIVPLFINEDLNISSNAEFDASGLNLEIKGDFNNAGLFTSNNNNTYFSGSSDQVITVSGTGSFYNLYKNTSTKLTIANDITVANDIYLSKGSFDDGGNSLFVQGDMSIDINTISSGGEGIVACGSKQQQLIGSPTLSTLKIDNIDGVKVPVGNQISISERLIMNNGIFDIDQNLLVIEKGAIIEEASSFSETNMIQTNISFIDAGIKIYFPNISSVTNYTYPIGSQGKYTPVTFSINTINDGGAIRVKAANECQPTVQDGLGTMGADETNNVLQYYWILDAEGTSGVDATVLMQACDDDESVTGSNDPSDYITARLRSRASGIWEKYGDAFNNDYNESTHELTFSLLGGDDQIDGDYTAGIDDAIPDQVAQYITQNDGDWSEASTWLPNIVGGPRGARVLIRHELEMDANYKVSYETQIDDGGKLKINDTFGHRLGNVFGTGTLYLERGDLPAGDYDGFFTADSGRIEYGYTGVLDGSEDYDILSSISSVNTVVISGAGIRRMPNVELQVYGDFVIGDGINNPEVINEYSQKLNISKDLEFNSGTYTSKTGVNSTINFNGTTLQQIKGSKGFTESNSSSFYNIELNNSAGLKLGADIEIEGDLTLSSGIINSSSNTLTLTNSSNSCVTGASNSSYIDGPVRKNILAGDRFDFPVGNSGRYGNVLVSNVSSTGMWEAEYTNSNPTGGGFDVDSYTGDVEYVNHNEYWRVQAPSSGETANLELRWDASSGVTLDGNFRVVRWTDLATDAWSELSIGTTTGTSSSGTADLQSDLSFGYATGNTNHYLTFGTISVPAYTWLGNSSDWFLTTNWAGGVLPSGASDITINSASNNPIIDPAKASGVTQVNNLTVDAGATLTIMPGSQFTVNGDLVTNDDNGLVIQNTNSLPASFIVNGSTTGNVKFEWIYDAGRYWYIGHSISNPVISSYDDLVGGSNNYKLYRYTGRWTNISKTAYDFTGKPLEGYAVKFNDQTTVTHVGSLNNNAQYTRSIGWGFNLMANPFPSYLDLSDIGQWNFGTALLTVYTRTTLPGDIRGYSAYNMVSGEGVNGGTQYVAPGQAFYVYNQSGNFDFEVNATTKIHTSGVELKSTGGARVKDDVIRFEMNNGITTDQSVIVFRSPGVFEMTQNDTEKRMENNEVVPNVYSLKGSKNIAINLLPEVENVESVQLGYKLGSKGSGVSTLRFTNIQDFQPGIPVYLTDHLTGGQVNLREEPVYEFMAEAGTVNERFEIVFEAPISTDVSERIKGKDGIDVYAYAHSGGITVVENLLEEGEPGSINIMVTDAAGKVFHSSDYKYSGKHIIAESFTKGIYMVVVTELNKGRYTYKVVVKD